MSTKQQERSEKRKTHAVFILLSMTSFGAQAITVEYPEEQQFAFSPEQKELIESIANAGEQEVREALPGLRSNLTLEVRAGPFVPETGIGGSATGPRTIWVMVHPGPEGGIVGVVTEHLRTVIFHESHHLVRVWADDGRSSMSHVASGRLIDRAISEGTATVFARDFTGFEGPWSEYPDVIEAWVDEILALPDDADQQEWMFEHSDGRQFVGYRVGAYLVDQAVSRSGKSAAQLALVPTDEVVSLALSR